MVSLMVLARCFSLTLQSMLVHSKTEEHQGRVDISTRMVLSMKGKFKTIWHKETVFSKMSLWGTSIWGNG